MVNPMSLRTIVALVLLASVASAQNQQGPVREIQRGGKTVAVYSDAQTTKLQCVVPNDVGWGYKVPPIENAPAEAFFKVIQGTRDVEIVFIRQLISPGFDPASVITQFESQAKQQLQGYTRETTDKIFSGKSIDPKKTIPFFGTREKGVVFAFSGVRLFLFEDPNTKRREVKPDPAGKVMYNQIWAVTHAIGQETWLYIFTIQVPEQNLDRGEKLNRPTIDGLHDLFKSIEFLR